MQTKIAAIGDKNIITIFKAVGAEVFACATAYKVRAALKKLCEDNYTLIFITEKEYLQSLDLLPQTAYPIILPIPNGVTDMKIGQQRIQSFTQKAIGAVS